MILLLVLVASCTGPTDNEDQSPNFLWEVTSDTNTVYILGSLHVARAEIYPLAEAIENAYGTSVYLVVEFDVNAVSESEMTQLLLEKGMYQSGESLRDNISEELYSRLYDRLMELDSSGLLLSFVSSFEPWVVAITITDMDYIQLSYDYEYGIETYFLEKAETDGKDIMELESAEFQLDVFDNMSFELELIMLEDIIDNPVTEDEMEALFGAWSTGDVAKMEQIVFKDTEDNPAYRSLNEIVIDERNFQMIEKIEQYLQDDETYFVVVGAAHLVGENGIINLLDNKGYQVTQQ